VSFGIWNMTSGQRSIWSWWCSEFDRLNLRQSRMEKAETHSFRPSSVSRAEALEFFYFANFSMSF